MAQKNYFAVVHKKNGTLLVISSMLPVYWNKRVANVVVRNYPQHEVKPVSIDDFNKLLRKTNNPRPADKK